MFSNLLLVRGHADEVLEVRPTRKNADKILYLSPISMQTMFYNFSLARKYANNDVCNVSLTNKNADTILDVALTRNNADNAL